MAIDARFIVQLKGKSYPTFAGALDAATEAGLKSLTTELVQVPGDDNGHTAIVRATAIFEDDRVFSDYGDASPRNVANHLGEAVIRIASTRAKGRVLRDAVNVGQALLEELGDVEDAAEAPRAAATAPSNGKPEIAMVCSAVNCGKQLTKGQYEVSLRAFGKPMCPDHQKTMAARQN